MIVYGASAVQQADKLSTQRDTMSINAKITIIFLVLGIVASGGLTGFNYYEARNQVFEDAYQKAEIISSFALATRNYTVDILRPLARDIAGPESFIPELMGGFFVARAVADLFSGYQPGYTFKQATFDPVNSDNRATAEEAKIIQYFRENRQAEVKRGIMTREGKQFIYVARPVVVAKGCLKCHDRKETAPAGRVKRYPGEGGYGYKTGDVVAAFINYVPVQKALDRVRSTAFKTGMAGVVTILLMLAVIWFYISVQVTRPLVELTGLAEKMSHGKGLEQPIEVQRSDEIGNLYAAFDRMRKSVRVLLRLGQKQVNRKG